jgi:hypothetical protein
MVVAFLAAILIMLKNIATGWAEMGFDDKYERNYNIFNSANQYRLDNPLNPAQTDSPHNPFNPVSRHDPNNPANPINQYNPNNRFNQVNRYDPANPLNPVNKYNPTVPKKMEKAFHESRSLAAQLPKLVSGELRVNEAEKFTERAVS